MPCFLGCLVLFLCLFTLLFFPCFSGLGIANWLMTLLMAFCVYTGNCIKDVVSAPRPSSPPVRIVTATKDEEENAMEYGLHSSHTLNTVFLSGKDIPWNAQLDRRYWWSGFGIGDPGNIALCFRIRR